MLVLTFVSLIMLLFGWPLILLFTVTGFEKIDWDTMPWDTLNLSTVFAIDTATLTFLGTVITYPVFVAINFVISIPGNALVDAIVHRVTFSFLKILGSVLIVSSFVILIIPEDKAIDISKRIMSVCLRLILFNSRNNILVYSSPTLRADSLIT